MGQARKTALVLLLVGKPALLPRPQSMTMDDHAC
jgi:hypothetical protein